MIIRRQLTSNFTIIPNEAILDVRLSISARWLLMYLLSRPNDWQVQVGDIQKKGGIGREKAYKLIKELVAVGWVRKDISRENGGQWSGVDYVVMDQPEVEEISVSPCAEKPYTAKPHTENHHLTKYSKEPSTEKIQNTESNITVDAGFEEFWAAYPKRPNNPKSPAKTKYTYARAKLHVPHETIMAAVSAYAATREGEDPVYTAQAMTWLNQRRWELDYQPVSKVASADVNKLMEMYPWRDQSVSETLAALKGSQAPMDQLEEAVRKYALLVKAMKGDGQEPKPLTLAAFIKFKWREMDQYEFCRTGMNNKLTVRPKREKRSA